MGIYLDGPFGVGKTHLAAAAVAALGDRARFGAFGDLTAMVGVLGLERVVSLLAAYRVLVIDEFELDDPGDTVMIARLIGELFERGTAVLATSNTLPERLGEGRFGADDFRREIGQLEARFEVVTLRGTDWRQRRFDALVFDRPLVPTRLRDDLEHRRGTELVRELVRVHPVRYRGAIRGHPGWVIEGPVPLDDQDSALRLVAFVDRAWEEDVAVVLRDQPLATLFRESWLTGGFRQRYGRALSRLVALSDRGGPQRQAEPGHGAPGWSALETERAAEFVGTGAEIGETVPEGGPVGVESDAVVVDLEGHRPRIDGDA